MSALQLQSLVGLGLLPLAAWVLRERGTRVAPRRLLRLVGVGIALQLGVAGAMLALPPARALFIGAAGAVEALQQATAEGTRLVFGYLGGGAAPFEVVEPQNGFILAFQALPLILLVSALTALLFHWGVLQRVVGALAWALGRSLGISGEVATAAAANVFVGMVEAPLFIRPYLARLDRSGLFAVMSVGLATIAGTVLALYAALIGSAVPDAAGHLVIASVISAPAALMLAALMVPPRQEAAAPVGGQDLAATDGTSAEAAAQGTVPAPEADADGGHILGSAQGSIDAVAAGTRSGVVLLLNVVAMLVVFVALVALVNGMLGALGARLGVDLSLEALAGLVFRPLVWAMGIPAAEVPDAAALMGIKTVTNEFIAFLALAGEGGAALSPRSALIMTYAMAGFANFGSVGIMIGGLGAMVPSRRAEIAGLGLRSLVAGTLATMMTGCVIGLVSAP